MLIQKIKNNTWAHQLALLALLFLSLAPTLSHFMAAANGRINFQPSICTSAQPSITIQVVTTKGQRLQTTFATEQAIEQAPQSELVLHLEHCPYCTINAEDQWLAILPTTAYAVVEIGLPHWQAAQSTHDLPSFVALGFSPRAPPALS